MFEVTVLKIVMFPADSYVEVPVDHVVYKEVPVEVEKLVMKEVPVTVEKVLDGSRSVDAYVLSTNACDIALNEFLSDCIQGSRGGSRKDCRKGGVP